MDASSLSHSATSQPDVVGGLAIRLLGGFQVTVGTRAVAEHEWRLHKARSLVKLLALAPDHQLHREQVIEWLWPDVTLDTAAHNLHQVMYVARRSLAERRCLQLQDEMLSLTHPQLWIDVEAFESAATLARRRKEPQAYRGALALYAGELLPEDRYEDWTAQRRATLRQDYQALLLELAARHESQHEYVLGIESLQRVLVSDPAYEEAHRGLMRLYALSGQRQLALRQYDTLRETLQQELDVAPDVHSERLYQDILANRIIPPASPQASLTATGSTQTAFRLLPTPQAPPPTHPAPKNELTNLPTQFASFIGRQHLIAAVTHWLTQTRLLMLTGAGGCGKTRLAIQAATELHTAQTFPDGVWLVTLESLADPALVPQAVAAALGVAEQSGTALLDTLRQFLKPLQLLLILDGCEHLLGACAQLVETLLRGCPHLRVLTTSREPLRIIGELTRRVPSLSVPDVRQTLAAEELLSSEAVLLFNERALAVQPSFALTQRNAASIAQICQRLDGIPLAIELAAARLVVLSVEEIAARLHDVFHLLTGGSRTALPRHQTLRALLDWSYDLLTERERGLLRGLSVFVGHFTLEAVEEVCRSVGVWENVAPPHTPTPDILELLTQLVNKSLVSTEEQAEGIRYRLLETVRQYAQEKMNKAYETVSVRRRHGAYYVQLAERAEGELLGAHQAVWLTRLAIEHDNLRAALLWSKHTADEDKDATTLMRLVGALWVFWYLHGHLSEGRLWLREALARRGAVPTAIEVKVLAGAGVLAWAQGDYAQAVPCCQECIALARQLGEHWDMLAISLIMLGLIARDHGELAQAIALHEESLALVRLADHKFGIALSLITLADALRHQGAYARARALLEESLALWRALDDPWGIALALHNLGNVVFDLGDAAHAKALNEQSLTRFRAIGNRSGIALSLNVLGDVAQVQGDYLLARQRLEESLSLFEQLGDHLSVARVLDRLGHIAQLQMDLVRAHELHARALRLRQDIGSRFDVAISLELFACVAFTQAQPARAARLCGAADALRRVLKLTPTLSQRGDHTRTIATVRAQLTAETWALAWAAGGAMAGEEAIRYALSET